YYWIHHHHPVAELGQIAVVEGYPPSLEMIDEFAARTGYGRPAFRTLEKHCHLDTNHRDDFDEALDRMPLEEEHFALLQVTALQPIRMAAKPHREVLKRQAEPNTLMPQRRPGLRATRSGGNGSFRLEDALRGTVYHLGEPEYFLLTQCDGLHCADEVCRSYG